MARPEKYRVTLSQEERKQLNDLCNTGKRSAKLINHARALLWLDQGENNEKPWTVQEVSAALNISEPSVIKIKSRFVLEGLEAALNRKNPDRPSRPVIFDGDFEAKVVQLACTEPPEGFSRWTVRLLADKLVELKIVPTVSAMTVQRTLKKTRCTLIRQPTGR